MRPLLLDIEGFASYRQHATVDFRDTDFFVLVGATGSGKSTVIDAMIFALYGTVPRWGERTAVAPALAPTVNRGRVGLIFDAGGQRYVAVRKFRRTPSGGVSVHEARLERFADSDAESIDDETTSLATGAREVSTAVTEVIGLSFEQFTKSVALPQGEFAQFLHATGRERQDILKRLLGYRIYDDIQRAAGSQATNEESRAAVLVEQLASYADATLDAVAESQARLDRLTALQTRVADEALPALLALLGNARDARARVDQLTEERRTLAAVTVPSDVHELDAETTTRAEALTRASEAATGIEERDTEARAALQRAMPRHELERIIGNWQTLSTLDAALPDLLKQSATAANNLEAATRGRLTAEADAERARNESADATKLAEQQEQQLAEVTAQLSVVESLRAPDGVDELGTKVRAANTALRQNKSEVDKAEAAQAEATAALDAAPDTAVLADAATALDEVRAILVEDSAGAMRREQDAAKAAKARKKAKAAAADLETAERSLRDAEHADLSMTLRADLVIGDDCPVCGRTVKSIPTAEGSFGADQARDRRQAARAAYDELEHEATELEAAVARSATLREERFARCNTARLRVSNRAAGLNLRLGLLANPIGVDMTADQLRSVHEAAESLLTEVRRRQEERTEIEHHRRAADAAVEWARSELRTADQTLANLQAEAGRARGALSAARDRVSSLSPPSVGDDEVESGWKALLEWATASAHELRSQIESIEAAAVAARTAADKNADELRSAIDAATTASEYERAATAAKTAADSHLESAQKQRIALASELEGCPDLDHALRELADVVQIQARVDQLSAELADARAHVDEAAKAMADSELATSASWQQLRAIRDSLSRFGAPQVDELTLTGAWQLTADWAQTEAVARSEKVAAELASAADADTSAEAARASLVADLAAHDVVVSETLSVDEVVHNTPVAVAEAVATARSDVNRIQERLGQSVQLRDQHDAAQEAGAVARRLSQLMQANRFPQWLIASALDTLLEEASGILMEISGSQFELRRKEGDLEVIDHNDADMARPVKTLSGGETFQASLALALALSSQVTALSASGAKTLDSILLDEGFGTLDETTLDTVASTLEKLASSGSRMVGVITHVAALAERIPVRFEVKRDSAGSHIERMAF